MVSRWRSAAAAVTAVALSAGLVARTTGSDRSEGSTAAPAAVTTGKASVGAANIGASVPVAASPTATGRGFWVASTDGAVTPEGDAPSFGGVASAPLAAPVVSIATTASGRGYWLLGGDGGVFSLGDARFYGSTGNIRLKQPALELVGTRTGQGYWFVARDGGVFTFGDAGFYGSTGNIQLNQPVVGMAATRDGRGYWLVARDGGVFTFGDARFHGSTGAVRLQQPVVGMAATRDGGGYWLVARDGGIFTFGDAHFYGSAGGSPLPAPVVGMVATGDGGGYWIVLGNGQIRSFGDASRIATNPIPSAGYSLVGQVVAIDPGHDGGNSADPGYIDQLVWNGRAYETCDTTGTETDAGYTEHAFNFDVSTRLAALLRARGATVILTRTNDTGVGPCVTQRAAVGNQAGADAFVDIHADGGPAGGRGVTLLEPVPDGPNDAVIGPSDQLAVDVRDAFVASTGEPWSDYDGSSGLQARDDLAGLNLTTVPKTLIECANMRNGTDAALVTDPSWRQRAAAGIAGGLSQFLIGFG
ncbi:MAG TPA: N-acetylmuramoyl-L-alanine amidase [Acidimicrobiales bacterium]